MSELPEYQKLLSNNADDPEDQATQYPPTSKPKVVGTGKRVIYTYKPIFPRTGEETNVVGTIGKDQETTRQLVYEYFPNLLADEIPSHRITLRMPVNQPRAFGQPSSSTSTSTSEPNTAATPSPAEVTGWANLTDFAWTTFEHDTPERLFVYIEDAEGEVQKRQWEEAKGPLIFMAILFGVPGMILFFVWLAGGFGK